MIKHRKRVSPTERLSLAEAKRVYPLELTERDIEIFKALAWFQALTTEQISQLFFPGNWSTCTKRLLKLFQNRFIWRERLDLTQLGFKEGSETLLHTLDEEGARVLTQQRGVPVDTLWQPRDRKIREQDLRHLILQNDIRLSIKVAGKALGYTVEYWETDQTLRRKTAEQKWLVEFVPSYEAEDGLEGGEIVPDDWLTLVTPGRRYISILEFDTGTELRQPQQRPKGKDTSIATKARRYIAFFHKKDRSEPSLFEKITGQEQKGIRVFFITTGTDKAVDNLLTTLREAGAKNSYWVGRYALARREDFILTRPIWRKAGDTEPIHYPWIGMSYLEKLRHRLQQHGVGAGEIEVRVTAIINLAKSQLLDGWSERKLDMSLEQAVALRSDELAEAILKRFEERVAGEGEEAGAV